MAFPSLWSESWILAVVKIAENRGDPLLLECLTAVGSQIAADESHMLPVRTAWPLSDCLTDSKSQWPDNDGQSRRERVTVRTRERQEGMDGKKKKNSGERDCIFGSALPWPLAHFISLLSVLLLNAVPPTAAVVSFFIVWYKMRLNQRVNGFTRLHMFFGAVEFLRKDCGLTFPSQPLSFSSPAQIVGQ